MRRILTIAISTYNKAKNMAECLNRIIENTKNLDVEIIILDSTKEVVKPIIDKKLSIQYYRNSENLGR